MSTERPYYPPPKPTGPPPSAPQSPPPVAPMAAPAQPSPYWPLSIIATVLTLGLGAVALIFSSQASSKWSAGDVAGVRQASQWALILGIGFIVLGAVVLLANLA